MLSAKFTNLIDETGWRNIMFIYVNTPHKDAIPIFNTDHVMFLVVIILKSKITAIVSG